MREKFQELRERFNSQSGFTLIELMATLAILALIVVIAVPAIGNIINSADEQSEKTSQDMIERAAEIAYVNAITDSTSLQLDAGEGDTLPNAYTAQELIDNGFLDLENVGDFADPVTHMGNGAFEYNGTATP